MKLIDGYFVQFGRSGEPVISCSSVEPLQCDVCTGYSIRKKLVKVYLLDGAKTMDINSCNCLSFPEALMSMGLFPSSPPQRPTTAFSFGLLKFFKKVRDN
ncbi:unnamed protein product [Mucor hiemalis]